jgi:ABC-type cobalamin/Fe3+-siderophores transport system ATPase subunit
MHYLDANDINHVLGRLIRVNHSDRIIGMRKGTIVFDGKPEELTDSLAREIYAIGAGGGGPHDEDVARIMVRAMGFEVVEDKRALR